MTSFDTATVSAPVFTGMHCIDTSRNPRIPVLMQMVGDLSRATKPQEVISIFARGLREIDGDRGYISLSTRGLKPGEYRITRFTHEGSGETFDEYDPWSQRAQLPVYTGGILGDLIRQAYPEVIHQLDVADDPVLGDGLANYRSIMAIPLFDNGEPLNWAIFLSSDPQRFKEEELENAIIRGNLVGGTVKNTVISAELRRANAAIHKEVDQIAAIQRSLLPTDMPNIAGVLVGANYETFDRAGGDYYDFLPLASIENEHGKRVPDPKGAWALLVADASGHGPAAAVVMAMIQSLLHAFPHMPNGPNEVLQHINRHLVAKRIEGSFVTAFLGIYDPSTHQFSYARAGHNPPVLMSPEGDHWHMSRLDAVGGIPLGIFEEETYDEETINLRGGQTVVLYTDGITEAMDPSLSMFGVEGIEHSLTECSGEPECVIHHVTDALKDHEQGVRPSDDQTLVVVKILDDVEVTDQSSETASVHGIRAVVPG